MKTQVKAGLQALVFLGLMAGAVPALAAGTLGSGHAGVGMRLAGLVLALSGLALGLWCIRLFVTRGKGTQSPVAPPVHLVTSGPYAVVRNPMLLGVSVLLVGEALFFDSLGIAAWAAAFFLVVNLLLVLVEEPTLQRRFGSEYESYRRLVPRWVPRLRPGATGTGP